MKTALVIITATSALALATATASAETWDMPMGYSASNFHSVTGAEFVLDLVDGRDPRMGACADTGHWARSGVKPMDALKSATVEAATLLKQHSELGSIEPGKAADIIAVEGDPLRDMKVMLDIRFVMKDGVAYKRPPE